MINILFLSFVALISYFAAAWILSEKDIVMYALIALLLGTWFFNDFLIYLGFFWVLCELVFKALNTLLTRKK